MTDQDFNKSFTNDTLPKNDDLAIEEYKLLFDERRFIMTRYMQGIVVYIAVVAFIARDFFSLTDESIKYLFLVGMTVVNCIAFYSSHKFLKMVHHALNREAILADHLGLQKSLPLTWGYRGGIFFVSFIQALVLLEIVRSFFS